MNRLAPIISFLFAAVVVGLLVVVYAPPSANAFRGGLTTSTVAVTYTGLVANRTQIPNSVTTIAQNRTSRIEHFEPTDGAIITLKTVDVGYYLTSSGPVNGDAYTIKRYVEYPANTFTQITWSGATSVTVSAGGTVSSDSVSIAIPAGAKFWERTVNLSSSVTNFPLVALKASATTLSVDDGNSAADQGNSGTIAASGVTHFGSAAIVGTTSAAARSFLLVGDSITDGDSDATSTGALGSSGYVARMLDVHGYPYTKIAASGWTGSGYVSSSSTFQPFINAITYSDAINAFGSNDLATGDSAATIVGHYGSIYTQIGAGGVTVRQATITPKTHSLNGWIAPNDQTPNFVPNFTTTLNSLNTSIRAGLSGVSAVLEAADQAMISRNSDDWVVSPQMTTDGGHPTSSGAAIIAAALAGSL